MKPFMYFMYGVCAVILLYWLWLMMSVGLTKELHLTTDTPAENRDDATVIVRPVCKYKPTPKGDLECRCPVGMVCPVV